VLVVYFLFLLYFLFQELVNVFAFLFIEFVSNPKPKTDEENYEEHPTDDKGDKIMLI
jgi:hypothetical protein